MSVPSVSMALVESLPISLVLVPPPLAVLHTNLYAGHYLISQDTLTVAQGRLTAKDPRNTDLIQRAVERASNREQPGGNVSVRSLCDRETLRRLILKFVAIDQHGLANSDDGPGEQVIAVMIEFGQMSDDGARGLIETFELSPSQFDSLKKLSSGLMPKQIAVERGSELWTVRTHIRNIKQKMVCHTDNELIILFNRFARF